jgi:hypothetical protein
LLYNFLLGQSLHDAKEYVSRNNIYAEFIETKDRYNEYENKRIIRVKQIDKGLELIYTGFPDYKE